MSDPLLPPLDDGPGPARPLSPAESQALVRRTLELHFQAPRRRFAPWAIAASLAFFLAASSATAAWWIGQRQPEARARTITPPPPAPPPPPPPASVTTETTAAPAPAAPLESARQLADSPEPPLEIEDSTPTPKRKALRKVTPPRPGPGPSPTVQAADLLAEANALLAKGEVREAERRYVAVTVRFPGTSSAYVAWVAAAGLRLEHQKDPSRAERAYQQALALDRRGPLDPEIRYGLAECYRALGQVDAERAALTAFLAGRPSGPRRARAERRLAELGAP